MMSPAALWVLGHQAVGSLVLYPLGSCGLVWGAGGTRQRYPRTPSLPACCLQSCCPGQGTPPALGHSAC